MLKSMYLNITSSNQEFNSVFTEEFSREISLIIKNKFRTNRSKIIFFAEANLDIFYILKGGSVDRRLEEIKKQINAFLDSTESWVLIYLLFSEKKIKILTSKNMDYLPKSLFQMEQENIFIQNIQKGLHYYIREVSFQLEEFSENPFWT
jgi:hypothetical protein